MGEEASAGGGTEVDGIAGAAPGVSFSAPPSDAPLPSNNGSVFVLQMLASIFCKQMSSGGN